MNLELTIEKNPQSGEFKVVWKEKGKVSEEDSYYTFDLEDARSKLIEMLTWAQQEGYNVRLKGDRFIPDILRGFV